MRKLIIDKLINNIKKYHNYDDIKIAEIRYGLESLYLSIFKIIVIMFICFLLNILKELLMLFLFYGLLRIVCFGLHASNSFQCWVGSIVLFTLFPYLIKFMSVPKLFIIIVYIFMMLAICLYSPADTLKRPIISKKRRNIYKFISIVISIIYFVFIIFLKSSYVINILFLSTLLEVLLILPISYRLLGLSYNNYKLYEGRR